MHFLLNLFNSNPMTIKANEIGFRDLLNIVKKKSDKKRKLNNDFSNLKDEIKKNNNGLRQIRRIKSEKVMKSE